MSDEYTVDQSTQRLRALSRWENEGGAVDRRSREVASPDDGIVDDPALSNTELVQLRVRVIALENLVIALLALAPAEQLDLVREMAAYISPRAGFEHHPMTIRAASEMLSLLERSNHFRS